jgi:hypothetical protein
MGFSSFALAARHARNAGQTDVLAHSGQEQGRRLRAGLCPSSAKEISQGTKKPRSMPGLLSC